MERADTPQADTQQIYAGIDVALDQLDLGLFPNSSSNGSARRFANDDQGRAGLIEQLRSINVTLVVLEATGGIEQRVAGVLAGAGIPVAVVNPRQVRDFAKGIGRLAKSDSIDAVVLARFAHAVRPSVQPLKTEDSRRFSELLNRRSQLIDMRTAESNRKGRALSQRVIDSHDDLIESINKQLSMLDDELSEAIKQSPIWLAKEKLLTSVPGVGRVLSRTLLASLPELGTLNHAKIAAPVGVAPYDNDSGQRRGVRSIKGGRMSVRNVLYMGALTATRCNPLIREFYKKLRTQGKPFKVALIACARKLLTILNAILAANSPWNPKPVPSTAV